MTLDRFRPAAKRLLAPSVGLAKRLGATPNAVSALALLAAGAGAVSFYLAPRARPLYLVGAALVGLNGWLDLLDGELARDLGTGGPAGDLIDHVLDRYADVLLLAGLAAGTGRHALGFAAVTGVLMTSYLGTQAQAVGLDRVYGGLVGRADRLVIVAIGTGLAWLVPTTIAGLSIVGWILVLLAVAGHATAIQRSVLVYRALA